MTRWPVFRALNAANTTKGTPSTGNRTCLAISMNWFSPEAKQGLSFQDKTQCTDNFILLLIR